MTLLWTTPRVWKAKDPITKERLNAISDDLTYLYAPSKGLFTLRGTGVNQTTSSATFVDLDAAQFSMSVELSGARDVTINFIGTISQGTLGTFCYLDFFIDGSIYASSLSASAGATGLYFVHAYTASAYTPFSIHFVLPAGSLAAGVHTFKPRWRTSAGTATFYEASVVSQLRIGE